MPFPPRERTKEAPLKVQRKRLLSQSLAEELAKTQFLRNFHHIHIPASYQPGLDFGSISYFFFKDYMEDVGWKWHCAQNLKA